MNKYEVYRGNGHVALVQFSTEKHTPPNCCDYSKIGDGFPCYCGVAAIIHKHGSSNVYKFIHERHLTDAWKKTFMGLEFSLPDQSEVDAVINEAKRLVASGQNLRTPKAFHRQGGAPATTLESGRSRFTRRARVKKSGRTAAVSVVCRTTIGPTTPCARSGDDDDAM
jgi:hypothetical protein